MGCLVERSSAWFLGGRDRRIELASAFRGALFQGITENSLHTLGLAQPFLLPDASCRDASCTPQALPSCGAKAHTSCRSITHGADIVVIGDLDGHKPFDKAVSQRSFSLCTPVQVQQGSAQIRLERIRQPLCYNNGLNGGRTQGFNDAHGPRQLRLVAQGHAKDLGVDGGAVHPAGGNQSQGTLMPTGGAYALEETVGFAQSCKNGRGLCRTRSESPAHCTPRLRRAGRRSAGSGFADAR